MTVFSDNANSVAFSEEPHCCFITCKCQSFLTKYVKKSKQIFVNRTINDE